MAQRRKKRRSFRRRIRNRTFRWVVAAVAIGGLVWFDWTARRNAVEDTPHEQGPFVALARGAGGADRFDVESPYGSSAHENGRFRVVAYPYSVIPGGAEDVAELSSALARDPIVAAHYAGFDLARARIVRLAQERDAYVSYRLGNDIFWTSRKLKLRAGETVITDGEHTARTRCGNLVADIPPGPAAPREPAPELFDVPLHSDLAPLPILEFETPPADEPLVEPPTVWSDPLLPPVGIYLGPILPGIGFSPTWPSVPTPEPDGRLLLGCGCAVILAVRKANKNALPRG